MPYEIVNVMQPDPRQDEQLQQQRQANQQQYKTDQQLASQSMSASALSEQRISQGHDLCEEMFTALFAATNHTPVDTTAVSRWYEQTEAAWACSHGGRAEPHQPSTDEGSN